ncbi:MAG: type II toxin-antitoxin system VapC family toxin [Terriglobia bacterium]
MNPPRGPLLLDTSVYLRYIRGGRVTWVAEDREIVDRCILTVVVAAELYAGTRDTEEKEHLDALCQWHDFAGTLSHPDSDRWLEAGVLLGRYGRLHGFIRVADHFRDVLIALEAAKNKATLLTENARDFHRWQKLLRSGGQNLIVFDSRKLG